MLLERAMNRVKFAEVDKLTDYLRLKLTVENLPWDNRLNAVEEGSCRGIFKASTVSCGGQLLVYYHTGGYERLSSLVLWDEGRVRQIIKNTAINVLVCEDGLFFADEYVLSSDTVFVEKEGSKVKFVYIPIKKKWSREKAMASFMDEMRRMADGSGRRLIEVVRARFEEEGWSLKELIYFIDEIRVE